MTRTKVHAALATVVATGGLDLPIPINCKPQSDKLCPGHHIQIAFAGPIGQIYFDSHLSTLSWQYPKDSKSTE
jgi:hypothetical protein